jgi:glycine cleavage system transcriptional repressor
MTSHYAISVMAEDRIGIIHAVSQKISELGGDIADLSQTVLSGYFAMILLTSLPETVSKDQLITKLTEPDAQLGGELDISIKVLDALPIKQNAAIAHNAYVFTASGKDRIGFVAAVTGFCAERSINILDLDTRVVDDTYMMLLLVDLNDIDLKATQTALKTFSAENAMSVTLQHHDVFQATQEVSMPL